MNIFWFRRDLRIEDNAGLYYALKEKGNVQCLFIFDTDILERLENKADPRVNFIFKQLKDLNDLLTKFDSKVWVMHGKPFEIFSDLIAKHKISSVTANRDYEPYAIERDGRIGALLKNENIEFLTYKDHVIFEGNEVLKDDHKPYTVFTPYKRKWLAKLNSIPNGFYFKTYPSHNYTDRFYRSNGGYNIFDLPALGFEPDDIRFPPKEISENIIREYGIKRDYPAQDGTSRMGIHLRFGTISIRKLARMAMALNETFLSELIWRDFYSQILYHFPHVEKNAFRPIYDEIDWINSESDFEAWKEGRTGYPLVDAGMRELNETGYMHNRVRMVVASFLTKHLLIDWRWGEAYFAEKLLDFDLSSNNGGWQWAAGSGTDAAPYFRIFNPSTQLKKFDPDYIYTKKWVPEFETVKYPEPIVDHKYARERCLMTYKQALNKHK